MSSSCGLIELLRRLFPCVGTDEAPPYLAFPQREGSSTKAYETPPALPQDAFAAVAHLLELSGAYHHVVQAIGEKPPGPNRQIAISPNDILNARQVALAWNAFTPSRHFDASRPEVFASWLGQEGKALTDLFDWWNAVFEQNADRPVYIVIDPAVDPPNWWKPAVMILMAADETFARCGYRIMKPEPPGVPSSWVSNMTHYRMAQALRGQVNKTGPTDGGTLAEGITSISSACQDILAVVPKARTAAVGVTLRSLSNYLALLPPRGVAKASWIPLVAERLAPTSRQMNLLLVPFPFSVPARAFHGRAPNEGPGGTWGLFGIEQTWLQNVTACTLISFVKALADEAEKECGEIHGVVFPELALNQDLFSELSRRLPEVLPKIEIFVAGQSGDSGAGKRAGNFVSIAAYHEHGSADSRSFISRREKHHRWRIDPDQVIAYGLEGVLSSSLSWWEDIDLLSRRIDFTVVRKNTIFTALICEDLARIDPCQELLRAVGPSVVFALLMDAPQLKFRWPGRYATVLAEEPGTAILTFTSRALMTRQHRLGTFKSTEDKDRVVALWRHDGGEAKEIACPNWAHGVRLTLCGRTLVDTTLDGRDDREAVSWQYASDAPLRIKDVVSRFADLLGPDDVALQTSH